MTALDDFTDGQISLLSHEADNREDDEASKDACGAVGHGHQDGVPVTVVVELVVAGQSDQTPEGGAQGVEYLGGGGCPDLHLLQALQLLHGGQDVEQDPLIRPVQSGSSDQEDEQDEVGEECREVDDLPTGLNSLDQTETDDDPGRSQAAHQVQLEAAQVVPGSVPLQPQHRPLEVVLAGQDSGVHLQ